MWCHQIKRNQEIFCLIFVALTLIDSFIILLIWFYLLGESFKLPISFFVLLLFPISLVIVTSPGSDLFSVIEICVSDDWKGVSSEKQFRFWFGLKGGISYVAFSFTDNSSIDNFSLSFCLVNWLGMLISRNFFYCLFINPHQHDFCQHLSVCLSPSNGATIPHDLAMSVNCYLNVRRASKIENRKSSTIFFCLTNCSSLLDVIFW